MEYFVSKNHDKLNGRPFAPELVASRLCLNPKYNVSLRPTTGRPRVLLDSGAFQDIGDEKRLGFEAALDRQIKFEDRCNFQSTYLVSYDRIVDESPTIQGVRKKRRVASSTAAKYVEETVAAAKFLTEQRRELRPRRLVLSCQGVTPEQYISCLREILRFSEPADVIGFGGFCIVGQIPRFGKDYFEVLRSALPLIRKRGIKRIHIFGVGVFKLLIKTHVMCYKFGITPSYDTSSLELNAVYGRVWKPDTELKGPEGVHLTTVFDAEEKYDLYQPVEWAMLNIEMVSLFWERLNRLYPLPKERLPGYG